MTMDSSVKEKWAKCLNLIRDNIGEDKFKVWFTAAEPLSYENGHMVLQVPSAYYADLYDRQFRSILRLSLEKAFGCRVTMDYAYNVIGDDISSRVKVQSPELSKSVQNPIVRQTENAPVEHRGQNFDSQLNPALNFENYCVGKSNEVAYTIAEHIANHPEKLSLIHV